MRDAGIVIKMRWAGVILMFATSLGFAASHCPDPKLRQAAIGGDTIRGVVTLHNSALKRSNVRLHFSSGKTAWVGTTDENGRFAISSMPPGEYRLDVSGWGRTTVQLIPEPDKSMGGRLPSWVLILRDNACVVTLTSYP